MRLSAYSTIIILANVKWGIDGTITVLGSPSRPSSSDRSTASIRRLMLRRKLQASQSSAGRSCNEVVGFVSKAEIAQVATFFLQYTLADKAAFQSIAQNMLTASIKYELAVVKVCGSCDQVRQQADNTIVSDQSGAYGTFAMYCNETVYGHDAEHSAVAFVPLVTTSGTGNDTVATLLPGKLASMMSFHMLQPAIDAAPSELWTSSVSDLFSSESDNPDQLYFQLVDFLEGLTASATGAIGIVPDGLGYGASASTHNRTSFWQPSYMQAAVTTWHATHQWLQQRSGNCTMLSNTVTLSGASEGGYGVIPAAIALQRAGHNVLQVYVHAAPMNYEIVLMHIVSSYLYHEIKLDRDNRQMSSMLPYLAFLGSNENPNFANSGSGQQVASARWLNSSSLDMNLIRWFATPSALSQPELESMTLPDELDALNDEVIRLLLEGIIVNMSRPCQSADLVIDGITDKLCAYFQQGDLFDVLDSINVPTAICYGKNDTMTSLRNYPDTLFDNSNIQLANTILGGLLTTDDAGDHLATIVRCKINPIVYFVRAISTLPDAPNYVTALTETEAAQCDSRAATNILELTILPGIGAADPVQTTADEPMYTTAPTGASLYWFDDDDEYLPSLSPVDFGGSMILSSALRWQLFLFVPATMLVLWTGLCI